MTEKRYIVVVIPSLENDKQCSDPMSLDDAIAKAEKMGEHYVYRSNRAYFWLTRDRAKVAIEHMDRCKKPLISPVARIR